MKFCVPKASHSSVFSPGSNVPKVAGPVCDTDLRGNELQAAVLPVLFLLNKLIDFGIFFLEGSVQAGILVPRRRRIGLGQALQEM